MSVSGSPKLPRFYLYGNRAGGAVSWHLARRKDNAPQVTSIQLRRRCKALY